MHERPDLSVNGSVKNVQAVKAADAALSRALWARGLTHLTHLKLETEEYHRLKRRDCEVMGVEEFTEADAEAVRSAQPSAESAAFDSELKP
jgi:hypothetical protein